MYFVSLSTTTKIELNIFFVIKFSDLGNFVIKFIITEFYSLINTLINLIYSYNKYLAVLFYWQTMQLLIYIIIYFLNLEKI